MNNKQAIIDKIMTDAKLSSENTLASAQAEVEKILGEAKAKAESYIDANKYKVDRISKEIFDRSAIVMKMDEKKAYLIAKKSLIDEVFRNALDQFRKSKHYADYLQKVISSQAEEGDLIAICEEDKKIFTKTFVNNIVKSSGKKITLSPSMVSINGGVILVGKTYDKNLSLDVKFVSLRESIEKQVSQILFEEN